MYTYIHTYIHTHTHKHTHTHTNKCKYVDVTYVEPTCEVSRI
jgi:hypothetical protein